MIQYLHEVLHILGEDRRKLPWLMLLFLGSSLLDLAGIGLIGPYIALVIDPRLVDGRLGDVLMAVGLPREQKAGLLLLGLFLVCEGIGFMIADSEIDILASRLMMLQACWALDQGDDARQESSMAKVFCAEAIFRIVDRSMQALGGSGAMRENLVERIFRDTRLFRIYDGPSEVHRWAIAKRRLA